MSFYKNLDKLKSEYYLGNLNIEEEYQPDNDSCYEEWIDSLTLSEFLFQMELMEYW